MSCKMIVNKPSSCCSLAEEEYNFKKQALRDAVVCIGWIRITSVIFFGIVYLLVHLYSTGYMSMVLQIMLLVMIPTQIIYGLFLFLATFEQKTQILEVALWLCLLLAIYTTILGIMGCYYFTRHGYTNVHFVLIGVFGCMSVSLITVICHDILIIFTYKEVLQSGNTVCDGHHKMVTWMRV